VHHVRITPSIASSRERNYQHASRADLITALSRARPPAAPPRIRLGLRQQHRRVSGFDLRHLFGFQAPVYPENLIVASCNFYYDPTHRNPLPPEMMRFVMDARGFADTHVMRLRPVTLPPAVPDATLEIVRGMLSAAPDYAIVGLNV